MFKKSEEFKLLVRHESEPGALFKHEITVIIKGDSGGDGIVEEICKCLNENKTCDCEWRWDVKRAKKHKK